MNELIYRVSKMGIGNLLCVTWVYGVLKYLHRERYKLGYDTLLFTESLQSISVLRYLI